VQGGDPLDGVPTPSGASHLARSPLAAEPAALVSHSARAPVSSHALAAPTLAEPDGHLKAGPLPGPDPSPAAVALRVADQTEAQVEAMHPLRSADHASGAAAGLIAVRGQEPGRFGALPAFPDTGGKSGPLPETPVRRSEVVALAAVAMREAPVVASDVGADPRQPPGLVEAGSDTAAPGASDAARPFPALFAGAEGLWRAAQHMPVNAAGMPERLAEGGDLPGRAMTDAKAAPPGLAAIVSAVTGSVAATAPMQAPGLVALAWRQAEDQLLSTEPALVTTDRLLSVPHSIPPPAATPADPLPQLAARIAATLAQRPDGTTEIALSPDELGSVRLQFQADAQNPDRMVIHLAFDRPETMDLFRRHADQLTEAIRSAGYAEARLDFGQAGAGSGDGARPGWLGRDDDAAGQPGASVGERTANAAEPDRAYVPRLSGTAGMDLRL
jgi:hypothetical protein